MGYFDDVDTESIRSGREHTARLNAEAKGAAAAKMHQLAAETIPALFSDFARAARACGVEPSQVVPGAISFGEQGISRSMKRRAVEAFSVAYASDCAFGIWLVDISGEAWFATCKHRDGWLGAHREQGLRVFEILACEADPSTVGGVERALTTIYAEGGLPALQARADEIVKVVTEHLASRL